MIKIYTSYFYKVRFFKPNIIPVSTAQFDPRWFHDCGPSDYTFIDKNGILNGLRAKAFVPGPACQNDCRGPENCHYISDNCAFLRKYREQLNALDFNKIIEMFDNSAERLKKLLGLKEEPVFVLMVYEKPDNPCSERVVIHEWFAANGFPITELEIQKEKKINVLYSINYWIS